MTKTTYVIRSVKTGKMIEAHDEISREWGEQKVSVHNRLYPADQWVMVAEQI